MDEFLDRIAISPRIMLGKPVIKGTRLTVEHTLRELASGATHAELLDMYPRLTVEDIRAACVYAIAQLPGPRASDAGRP